MIKISDKFKLKKNVSIKRKDSKIIITNNSDKKGFIVFSKLIYCKNKSYKISSKIKTIFGEGTQLKILNRKLKVVLNLEQKQE